MFQANIEGLQQLKDGTVKFTLTCPEDQLVTVSGYRKKGKVTVMGADEAPVIDSRITALTNLHSVALQIAEAIDRELSQEVEIEQLTMGAEGEDKKYGGWDVDERGGR